MKTTSLKFLSIMVLLASTLILSSCGENVEKMIEARVYEVLDYLYGKLDNNL